MTEFDCLIGAKILRVMQDEAIPESIIFATPHRFEAFYAVGDCCSSSWWEHVSGIDNIVGHTITSIQEITMAEIPRVDEYSDLIQSYGFRFITDKGYFELELRNSSNGYYGGSVERVEGFYFPGTLKELKDK